MGPFLRHSVAKLPDVAEDGLWEASTAEEWGRELERLTTASALSDGPLTPSGSDISSRRQVKGRYPSSPCGLREYLELETIAASVMEKRNSCSIRTSEYCEVLMSFYEAYLRRETKDLYFLQILWHYIFISVFVDIDRLELAVGREGFETAQGHWDYVRQWASSADGQRCALHGALILRHLEGISLGAEPPIHIPRAMFRAALIWFCYSEFVGEAPGILPNVMDFPELSKLGVNCQRVLFEANGFKSLRPKALESSTFCGLVDILERIGHWGISRKFASILRLLVPSADIESSRRQNMT